MGEKKMQTFYSTLYDFLFTRNWKKESIWWRWATWM